MRTRRLPRTAFLALVLLAPLLTTVSPAGAAVSLSRVRVERRQYTSFGSGPGYIDQAASSPAVGDVDGDGRLEAVTGGMDGRLMVTDAETGVLDRLVDVDPGAAIQSSPTLVDFNRDGTLDVFVGTVRRGIFASKVVGLSLKSGATQVLFSRTGTGDPTQTESGFFASVVVTDLEGRGELDVVATSWDHFVYAWRPDGSVVPGFPVDLYDTVFSSPTIADIDGDGASEIVVGGTLDVDRRGRRGGGYLHVLRRNGAYVPGYPIWVGDEDVWSSPAVADFNGDGRLDAVFGSGAGGHPYAVQDANKLWAYDLVTRGRLWVADLGGGTEASQAVADLDRDGLLDVVATTKMGGLYALRGANGARLWSTCFLNFSPCSGTNYASIPPPTLGDLDGDGFQEVVVAGERELRVFDGRNGSTSSRSTLVSSGAMFSHTGAAAVALAKVNGALRLIVHVTDETNPGSPSRGVGDDQSIYTYTTPGQGGVFAWPTLKQSPTRLGVFVDPRPFGGFVDGCYLDLLGRASDPGGRAYWVQRLKSGLTRYRLAFAFANTPEYVGTVVDGLYLDLLGRPAEPTGRSYWSNRIIGGARVAAVAGELYGSAEFFAGVDNDTGKFVDALYRKILSRAADPGGRQYWVDEVARVGRPAVATRLFLSIENNGRRVDALYRRLLRRDPDPGGRAYWAQQMVTTDDIALAASLISSEEYFSTHQAD